MKGIELMVHNLWDNTHLLFFMVVMITTNGKCKVPLMRISSQRALNYLWSMFLHQLVHGQVYALAHQMHMRLYQTCTEHFVFSIKLPFPVTYARGIIKLMENDVGTTRLHCPRASLSLTLDNCALTVCMLQMED